MSLTKKKILLTELSFSGVSSDSLKLKVKLFDSVENLSLFKTFLFQAAWHLSWYSTTWW